ncbi:MAG: motility protein A [Phycisphaerae bacterium]
MDYATLVGIGSVLLLGLWAVLAGAGGDLGAFWNLPGLLLVLGGAVAATVASFTLAQLGFIRGVLRKAFTEPAESAAAAIDELVSLADVARREGILALEARLSPDDDRFLARAVRMVVDGYDPSAIEARLTDELEATDARHTSGRQFFDLLGRYCPAFGMVGTLVGLVLMLRNMNDPTRIGPGMAVALLTTLYGLVLANGVFLPLSQKLANRSAAEFLVKTIILKGVLAIQAGDNPRVVEHKLLAFLPPGRRPRRVGQAARGSSATERAPGPIRLGGAAA